MTAYGYIQSHCQENVLKQMKILITNDCDSVVIENQEKTTNAKLKLLCKRLNKGDKLIIVDVRSLNLNLEEFIDLLNEFKEKEIVLVSIQDNFDSRMTFSLEENLMIFNKLNDLSQTTNRKVAIPKETGRPRIEEEQIQEIKFLYYQQKKNMREIAKECAVALGTVHKYVNN